MKLRLKKLLKGVIVEVFDKFLSSKIKRVFGAVV